MDATLLWNRLKSETARVESVALPSRALWSRHLRRGQSVRCERGLLWLTQSGDATDYLLRAGDYFRAQGAGKVVVQALEACEFCVENNL